MSSIEVRAEDLKPGDVITASGSFFEGAVVAGHPYEEAVMSLGRPVYYIAVPLQGAEQMELEGWDSKVSIKKN